MKVIYWLVPVAALLLVPAGNAQGLPVRELDVDFSLSPGTAVVGRLLDATANFQFQFRDASIGQIAPAAGTAQYHFVDAKIEWNGGETPAGWAIGGLVYSGMLPAGGSGVGTFQIFHATTTTQRSVGGTLTLTLSNPNTGESTSRTAEWAVVVLPSPSADVRVERPASDVVRPDSFTTAHLSITNTDAYGAAFTVSAIVFSAEGIDPADFAFGGTGSYYLEPGETQRVDVIFKTPRTLFWYKSVPLQLQFAVEGPNGSSRVTTNLAYTVDGFFVPVNLIFLILAALLQAAILVAFIVYARRRYESRFFGRPVPPWTIPEEAANLERLKREDPRAHYVMRYFLMEEEYRSALLWFFAYKKINKRQLKAELKAVALREKADTVGAVPLERHERTFERLQRRYERRIERAKERTTKQIANLQARLDRSFEKDFDKDHEAWEKQVEKLREKHERPVLKAKKKWEAETQKILAKWEKPFKKDREKYERALAKAKEAYALKVKKADKPAWKEWRGRMEDWEVENKLRKKEGRELAPEPDLMSTIVGPPELPPAFVPPPRPDLPPEPRPTTNLELPPEPTLTTPDLAHSHYSKDARAVEQDGLKRVRDLERALAAKLHELQGDRSDTQAKLERKRERILEASQTVQAPSFVDKVLRRTPAEAERRHTVAYIKGLTKERIKELHEAEETVLERVRIEGERAEAALEAQILGERASLSRAQAAGDASAKATESEKVQALVRQRGELKITNAKRMADERRASKERLETRVAQLRAEERERLARETGADAPDAKPTQG